jgi:hypothetical protein
MKIVKPEKLTEQLRLVMTKTDRHRLDVLAEHYGVSRNELVRQLIQFAHEKLPATEESA